jgi:hypothetical protein
MIRTNFGDSITDQDVKRAIVERVGDIGIAPDAIARGVLFAFEQPPTSISAASSSGRPHGTESRSSGQRARKLLTACPGEERPVEGL